MGTVDDKVALLVEDYVRARARKHAGGEAEVRSLSAEIDRITLDILAEMRKVVRSVLRRSGVPHPDDRSDEWAVCEVTLLETLKAWDKPPRQFVSHAFNRMRKAVSRWKRHEKLIPLSEHRRADANRLRATEQELIQRHNGRRPTINQLAEVLQLDPAVVHKVQTSHFERTDLKNPEEVKVSEEPSPEASLLEAGFEQDLQSALKTLDPHQLYVVVRRQGLDQEECGTFDEIAQSLGITRSHAASYYYRAMERLRAVLIKKGYKGSG